MRIKIKILHFVKAFLVFLQISGKKEAREIKLYWLGNDENSAAQNCAFLSFSIFFKLMSRELLVPSNAKTSAKQLSNLGKTKQAAGDVFGIQGQPEHIFSVTTMFNFLSQPQEISKWLALIVALPVLLTHTFAPSCPSHSLQQVQKTMKTVHNRYF